MQRRDDEGVEAAAIAAASTPSSSRRSIRLWPRLVGLDGGAAGAELLRLATGVFELGAGIGVDELAGLDPLEAVTL